MIPAADSGTFIAFHPTALWQVHLAIVN